MKTYEERYSRIKEITQHVDIELVEIFVTTYNWWRYENALRTRNRAWDRMTKYGKRLDEQVEVLGARAEMRNL